MPDSTRGSSVRFRVCLSAYPRGPGWATAGQRDPQAFKQGPNLLLQGGGHGQGEDQAEDVL